MLAIDLTDKRALVTGVTSGIGRGIARALAQAGCNIAGCGSSAATSAGAQAFLGDVANAERQGHYHQVDLRVPGAVAAWVTAVQEALGGIDIVISNAGRNVFAGAAACTEAEWDDGMNLDLAAHWRLAQAARPHLLASDTPVIVVIASNHAYGTIPGCFPYNVAKAGLVALVQSLAIEWGPQIRAVGIAPGFIDTPGNDAYFATFADPAQERARVERYHPVGRLGTIDEIGALCAFLASQLSSFISGTTILVDGGRSALLQDL